MKLVAVWTAIVAATAVACSSGSAHPAAAIATSTPPTVMVSPSPTAVVSREYAWRFGCGRAGDSLLTSKVRHRFGFRDALGDHDGHRSVRPVWRRRHHFQSPRQFRDDWQLSALARGRQAGRLSLLHRCSGVQRDQHRGPVLCRTNNPVLLLCAHDPSDATVVRVTPTQPLPVAVAGGRDPTSGLPWTLVLTDGDRCGLITGGTNLVAALRLNYGCADGGDVYGDPNRSTPLWRVYFTAKGAVNLHQVQVDRLTFDGQLAACRSPSMRKECPYVMSRSANNMAILTTATPIPKSHAAARALPCRARRIKHQPPLGPPRRPATTGWSRLPRGSDIARTGSLQHRPAAAVVVALHVQATSDVAVDSLLVSRDRGVANGH